MVERMTAHGSDDPRNHVSAQPTIAAAPALPLRDRIVVLAEIGALTALAWIYLVRMPMSAADLGHTIARIAAPLVDVWLTFMMWAVMMVAMMLPSAAPMILTYAKIAGGRTRTPILHAWLFAAGYVVVWSGFSAAATASQVLLARASMISSALSATPIAGGAILVAAGIYQLTPLKRVCLGRCQSPIAFLMTRWRDGAAGALRIGLEHGALCVGCCWMLMALLFVAGVMNLVWVAAISAFVLVEKIAPHARLVANVAGVVLIACGVALSITG